MLVLLSESNGNLEFEEVEFSWISDKMRASCPTLIFSKTLIRYPILINFWAVNNPYDEVETPTVAGLPGVRDDNDGGASA